MKHIKYFVLLLIIGIVFQLQAQETVVIESSQMGRGILKSRSGECFVITPQHVVKGDVSTLNIIGSKNVLSNGKLVQEMEKLDLAIVRVTDGGTQNCTNWSVPKNYTTILNNSIDAYLELRYNDGATQLMHVFITGKDENMISIKPKFPDKDAFIKGMSGGSLFTQYEGKKVYLGMLQKIGLEEDEEEQEEEDNKEGLVLQADDMERYLSGFFGDTPKQSSITSMTTTTAEASAFSVEEEGYRFDLLSVKKSGDKVVCKLKVTSLEKDGELEIYARYGHSTDMYDQNGVKTHASNVKLGNQSNHLTVGKNYKLIKGVPVPLEFTFKEVDENATGISYLKIQTGSFKIDFRNISF